MSKNEIANQKVEIPNGVSNNDKDYLNCLLSKLKDLEKNYAVALTEASNEKLFSKIKKTFDELASLQRKAFELAFQKGWYTLESVEKTKIDKEFKKLSKEIVNLNLEEEE